jgi:hypothetical protein
VRPEGDGVGERALLGERFRVGYSICLVAALLRTMIRPL